MRRVTPSLRRQLFLASQVQLAYHSVAVLGDAH